MSSTYEINHSKTLYKKIKKKMGEVKRVSYKIYSRHPQLKRTKEEK